jgi:hypothetical protein
MAAIKQIRCGMEGLDPISHVKVSLKQKCVHDVIYGPNAAFGLAVLGGSMGTRKMKNRSLGGEERAKRMIVKFTTIVTLYALHG